MPPDAISLTSLKRALVIKLRHHGDVLLASPVFSVLKARAPQLEIDALVYADTAPMLSLHPAICEVHTIDRTWKKQGLLAQATAEAKLFSALRQRRYGLIIHLTEHPRGAWLSRLLRPRYAVAQKLSGKGDFWRGSFTHLYGQPLNARRHTVERNLDALRRVGIQPEAAEKRLTLMPGPAAKARADALLAQYGLTAGNFIHIHPTSRWLFKCWTAAKVAALLDALSSMGLKTVLTAAPDAKEKEMLASVLAAVGNETRRGLIDLGGQLTLKELAAISGRAQMFVGVDSAPMHIAAAMGTPTVALFGPSGELEWGPWGVSSRVIASANHPCRPCGIDGCGGGKLSECLTSLQVEQVLIAVRELLEVS